MNNNITELFSNSNHLGAFNPLYYVDDSGKFQFSKSLNNILNKYKGDFEIDMAAMACVLSKRYMFGDKTIIKGIYRTPWMARPNDKENEWNYHTLPNHGQKIKSQDEITDDIFQLLCEEIKTYIGDNKSIGILLSGGMDSRIVAGIINYLQEKKEISIDNVVAYTWGNSDSRDVVYAKRIALQFGWKWNHYKVGAEKLWRNILLAGERGCEFSGIHLHAMPDIAGDAVKEVDIILGGSYGDSVGRAEFSDRHITNLLPIEKGIKNFGELMDSGKYKTEKNSLLKEVQKYHSIFPRDKNYQQMELDYQLHYMRRMLNPCMEVIHEKVPLHQVFTAPKVFSYIWSLDPKCRGNELYKGVFDKYLTSLQDIPWARTGLKYGEKSGVPDGYSKRHHNYEYYMENSLKDRIAESIDGLKFPGLNSYCIKQIHKNIIKYPNFNFDYIEVLSGAISFGVFTEKYNIKMTGLKKSNLFNRNINLLKLNMGYHIKRSVRKFRK